MSEGPESVADRLPPGLAMLTDPVLLFDDQGEIRAYNERLADMVDTVSDAVDIDSIEEHVSAVTSGSPDGGVTVPATIETGDSRRHHVEFRLSPVPDGEDGAVVGVGRVVDTRERENADSEHRDTGDSTADDWDQTITGASLSGDDAPMETADQTATRTLAARERALHRAYDTIADTDRSLDEKIARLLGIVRETVGTEFGTLSRVDGDVYVVEAVDGPPDGELRGPDGDLIEEGTSVPLSTTNCERVVETAETLVLDDIEQDAPEMAQKPVNVETGSTCYIGTPVERGDDLYGTFCFYDTGPRREPFSTWEVTFVELLGDWVSHELEREWLIDQIRAEERERYETLVEQSNDAVVVVQDGEYAFVNDRFVELTGRDRSDLLGTAFEAVFTPEYRGVVTERYEQRLAGEDPPTHYDVEIETPQGATRTLELAVAQIDHGNEPATMATLRDVTARTRREQSIRGLQTTTRELQSATTREAVAATVTEAATAALDFELAVCWFHDAPDDQLVPAAATDAARDQGIVESVGPGRDTYEAFLDGSPTEYDETGNTLQGHAGLLLPLGDHGLLAVGHQEPTAHDEVRFDIAVTLAEHTQITLDRIERTTALEQARARFRAFTENTSYGIVTIDESSTIRYASDGVESVFGYEPAEVVGEPLHTVMSERFHTPHDEAISRYLREGTKNLDWSWIELPGLHRDGHEIPLGISFGEATVDGEKRFTAVIRDITEQEQRKQKLREERALTESVFSALPDVFYAFDEHGQFFRWNDRLEEVTGYSDEEIQSMHPADFVAPEDRATVVTAIADVFEQDTTITVEAAFETKGGERVPYEFTGAKLTDKTGEALGIVGIGRDISDRKERQRRFEAVFNNTYQFTGLMKPDGTLIEANETALEFGDLDRDDVVGEKVWDAFWFAHTDRIQEEIQTAVERARDGEFVRDEVTVQGADREAVIDFSLRPVSDETGAVTLLIPEGRDITKLKEREQALRRERDHVRRTEELADVGGWELTLDTEELYWTEGTRALHDVGDEFEPTMEAATEFLHPEDRDSVVEALEACREDGEPFDIEARLITKKGRTRWVRLEGEHIVEDGVHTVRGVIGDITDRKEREQRLMVLNRVLRHNLRNKLSVITGYATTLTTDLDVSPAETDIPVERAQEQLQQIQDSATDLVNLAKKARRFERAVETTTLTGSVAIQPVLRDVVAEYREQYPEVDITVDTVDASVRGSEQLLELAVTELVENGIQHNDSRQPSVEVTARSTSTGQVEITVTDNGPGIPESERGTLTEGEETPLLHGSGVGLWTVNWLMTRLGGEITIDEAKADATAVTLTVPVE